MSPRPKFFLGAKAILIEYTLFPGLIVSEEWTGIASYQIISVITITVMALVLLAAVSYQCAATWRWLRTLGMSDEEAQEGMPDGVKQASIRISHSLPDLQQENMTTRKEYVQEKDSKKVSAKCTRNTLSLLSWNYTFLITLIL